MVYVCRGFCTPTSGPSPFFSWGSCQPGRAGAGPPQIPQHISRFRCRLDVCTQRPQATHTRRLVGLNAFCVTQNLRMSPAPCHRTLIPVNRVSSGRSSKPPALSLVRALGTFISLQLLAREPARGAS